MVVAMQASFVAVAAMSARPSLDANASLAMVEERRAALVDTLFPYLHLEAPKVREETDDDLFDELDAIIAKHEAEAKQNQTADGDSAS